MKLNFKNFMIRNKKIIFVTATIFFALILCTVIQAIVFNSGSAIASPTTSNLKAKMDELQPVLNQTSNDVYLAQEEADETQAAVDEAQSRIDYCNERIPQLQNAIGVNAKTEYKENSLQILNVLTEANSIFDVLQDFQMLDVVNSKKAKNIKEFSSLRDELDQQMMSLQELNNQKQDALNRAAKAQADAQAAMDELEIAYANATEEERAAALATPIGGSSWGGSGESSGGSGGGGQGGGGGYAPWNGWGGWTGPGWLPRNNWPTTGNPVADRALSQIGKPYVWNTCGPGSFDCSGLVSYAVTGEYGHRIGWTGSFINLPSCAPQVGAICVIHDPSNMSKQHCGIFVGWDGSGNPCMVHAPTFGDVVRVTTVMPDMITVMW